MEIVAAVIMTTVKDHEEAAALARRLIEGRLAACVQETSVHSHFNWEGKTNSEPEVLLLIKTSKDRINDAVAAIREVHSYDVPEILVTPVIGGLDAYLQWVKDETR